MGVREIYIREMGNFVKIYQVGEYVAGNKWKEQSTFQDVNELINYFRNNDKYTVQLRKRGKNLRINILIENNDITKIIIDELKKVRFERVKIIKKEAKNKTKKL